MDPKAPMEQLGLGLRDPVLDFIARAYGKPEKDVLAVIEKNLRQMIDKFATCQGELFLFVRRYLDSCKRDLMLSCDFDQILITELYLSIISGELQFGEAETPFHFPIRYPYATGDLFSKPFLSKGTVCGLDILHGYEVMMWLKESRKDPDMEQPGLDIAVGDEEVKELIRQYQNRVNRHYVEFPLILPVYKMCHLLGRYLTNFPEQAAMIQKSPDLFKETVKVKRP